MTDTGSLHILVANTFSEMDVFALKIQLLISQGDPERDHLEVSKLLYDLNFYYTRDYVQTSGRSLTHYSNTIAAANEYLYG